MKIGPYGDVVLNLNARMVGALLSGLDAGTYADGSSTRGVVADLRTIKALDRRGLITWRAIQENGRTWPERAFLSPFGRAEAKRIKAAQDS
jgi:hypothetical protein